MLNILLVKFVHAVTITHVFIFTLVRCTRPLTPPNGFYSQGQGYTTPAGHRVSYRCDYGYKLIGSATISCQTDAQWSAPVPTCERSRSNFDLNY